MACHVEYNAPIFGYCLASFLRTAQKYEKVGLFPISRNGHRSAEFGTTNETLSRTFAELRNQKLIFVMGRRITILKPRELEELFKRNVGDI